MSKPGGKERRMKRLLAALLAAVMLAGCAGAEDYHYDGPAYDPDRLVIGNPTRLTGNFTTLMWGNNTSDIDISGLVNGYNLIRRDEAYNVYLPDETVVDQMLVIDGENRTYLITINDRMTYSDGTPITSADYVFSILLCTSPAVAALGGNTDFYPGILGAEDYRNGNVPYMAGLRMLSEYTFSVTVRGEYLPFFYEAGMLRCYPMPIHIIAPGCKVEDNGSGAEITGDFSAEMLQDTLLDPEHGYVSHPAAVSGAYRLISYDPDTGIAEFEINDAYLGNHAGCKPSIRYLTVKPADNETMISLLEDGEFGLLNKCTQADTIEQGVSLRQEGNIDMTAYPRTGMTFISFNCEREAVSSAAVRQAIACCLDKDEVIRRYTGNRGIRVDGYYGIGQWMYRILAGTMSPPEEDEAFAEWLETRSLDDLPRQELDPERAAQRLETDGWVLNGENGIRQREENGQVISLDLTLAYPEGNQIGEILADTFLPYLQEAGIRVTLEPMPWEQLLRQYYRQEERNCDMMFLGSDFREVFDPEPTFDPADAGTGLHNYSGIRDEKLYKKARDLSMTDPGNAAEYEKKWIAFQQQYGESVPAIPVYSNVYYDFYTRYLQNYRISDEVTWSDAIIGAYMSDPVVPEEE